MRFTPFWVFTASLALSSCSSLKGSLILGGATGAATGAAIGATMATTKKGTAAFQGALVGAAISGLAGFFIHKGLKKRDQKVRQDTLFNLDKFGVDYPQNFSPKNSPAISKPVVESQWIDSQVNGKKLIEGHRVWIISEDSQWVPNHKR